MFFFLLDGKFRMYAEKLYNDHVKVDVDLRSIVLKELNNLLGGFRDDHIITDDMKKGILAQPIIVQRADLHATLIHASLDKLSENWLGKKLTSEDVSVNVSPGMAILPEPDLQVMASTTDIQCEVNVDQKNKIFLPGEIKFTNDYKDSSKVALT